MALSRWLIIVGVGIGVLSGIIIIIVVNRFNRPVLEEDLSPRKSYSQQDIIRLIEAPRITSTEMNSFRSANPVIPESQISSIHDILQERSTWANIKEILKILVQPTDVASFRTQLSELTQIMKDIYNQL